MGVPEDSAFVEIAVGVILLGIGATAGHLAQKYWYRRPKVTVSHRIEVGSVRGLEIGVRGSLQLYNGTSHNAEHLICVWSSEAAKLSPRYEPPPHVAALETIEIPLVEAWYPITDADRRAVGGDWAKWSEYIPGDRRSFALILEYRNDRDTKFYTRFQTKDGVSSCTFHRRRPDLPS